MRSRDSVAMARASLRILFFVSETGDQPLATNSELSTTSGCESRIHSLDRPESTKAHFSSPSGTLKSLCGLPNPLRNDFTMSDRPIGDESQTRYVLPLVASECRT